MGHVGCGESCMEIGVARWVFILGGFKWGFDRWKEIGSTDRVGFNGVLIGVGSVEVRVFISVYIWRSGFDCVGFVPMGF